MSPIETTIAEESQELREEIEQEKEIKDPPRETAIAILRGAYTGSANDNGISGQEI